MNQRINLSRGIQYIIAAAAILLFLLIWPFGIIENRHTSKSDEVILRKSDPISVEHNGTQMFIAQGTNLNAVDLYIANDMRAETITFRLYDGAYQQLWETFYVVDADAKFPGFIRIPVELETEEGWEYYYTVEGLTSDLEMYYEDTAESSSFANGTFLYGGEEMPGINLIVRYRYVAPFSWWMTVLLGLLLAAIAVGLWKLTERLFAGKWKSRNKEITVQRLLQGVLIPLILLTALAALLMVFPGRRFGRGIVNYGFYYLGIVLTAGVLLYGVNHRRLGQEPLVKLDKIKSEWTHLAMSVCFAGALWSCYEYMNGLYDIHHSYATCRLLVWFSLAVIFTFRFTRQELLRIYNLIYLVAAGIGGYFYARPYQGVEELEELYRLQAYVLVAGGFVLLQLVIALVKMAGKKQRGTARWYLPYTGVLTVLLLMLVIFRNTRTWPILLAVIFGLFYLRMWMWEERNKLPEIFCGGLILHFVYTVGYCLMHRPYLRFRHNRYGMTYHTVTMTGYYLALVLCAIMVRLFVQYRRTGRWQDAWKELCLLGTGNVYLFLTLSRTGYLAAFVMEVFILVFMSILWEGKTLRAMLKAAGLTVGISILFFPIVFTAQRIMPSLFNDPIYSEIEVWEYTTQKTTPSDSELYIDLEAFIKIMKNKLFGLEMENISLTKIGEKLQPVYLKAEGGLVASTAAEEGEERDFSNGRIEIFREYIGQWNATGHDEMGFLFPDGEMSVHAHNTYLQVAHDHGVITGLVFLLFGIYTFLLAVYRYCREREGQPYLALTITVIIAFGIAGMVEWIFHPCNPFGFSLMVAIAPLLFKPEINGGHEIKMLPEQQNEREHEQNDL